MNDLEQLLNQCLESSYFYSKDDRISKTIESAMSLYSKCYTEIPVDESWPQENNDVSQLVDGFSVNANILNTHNLEELYSGQVHRKTEILLESKYDPDMEKVPPMDHSIGLKMTILSEHLSEIYEKCIDDGVEVQDINPTLFKSYAGNLAAVEWFDKPVSGSGYDNDRSSYVRKVWNYLLRNMSAGSRMLSIGGDSGGASKRRRDYYIDCLYFEKKKYERALKDRLEFGGMGEDYLLDHNFLFDDFSPDTWKVCTFTYYAEEVILDKLYDFFKDSSCDVWGTLANPYWGDTNCVYSQAPYDLADIYKLPMDYSKAKVHYYQIIGRNRNKIALYTTHGRFEDVIVDYERDWLVAIPFDYLSKIIPKSGVDNYVPSLMHTSLYMIKTKSLGLQFEYAYFPIPRGDYFNIYKDVYTLEDGNIYDSDRNVVLHGYPANITRQLLVYNGPIHTENGEVTTHNELIVMDSDASGSYYHRRFELIRMGFRDYREGMSVVRMNRKWTDGVLSSMGLVLEYLDKYSNILNYDLSVKYIKYLLSGGDLWKLDEDMKKITILDDHQLLSVSKSNTFPLVKIQGVTYNPYLNGLVCGIGFESYLVPKLYDYSIPVKFTFKDDLTCEVYVRGKCLQHGCDMYECIDLSNRKEDMCIIKDLSLSIREFRGDEVKMQLYFPIMSYSKYDKLFKGSIDVVDSNVVIQEDWG